MKWIIFLFLSSFAVAKDFTPQELIKFGEVQAPLIRSQLYSVEGAKALIKQSKTLANPILTFQSGSLKTGTQSGAVADITINQPLPWPGKMDARVRSHEFLMGLAELDQEETKLQVAHRIYLLAAEIAASQEIEKNYSKRKERFSLIQKFLRTRPHASPKQAIEKDLIEAQINVLEKNIASLVAKKEAAIWELEILSGAKIDQINFNWTQVRKNLKKDDFLEAFEQSPKVRRLKVIKNLSESRINEARLEARPDIMVGVNYRQENVNTVNHFYHGQVSVVIPILDHGQHSVSAAKANFRRSEALNSVERNQGISAIHMNFAHLESSYKNMQIFPISNLHSMDEKFGRAEDAFKKGQIDALTFLQSDVQTSESIQQTYLTRLEYLYSLSGLDLLVGRPPEI